MTSDGLANAELTSAQPPNPQMTNLTNSALALRHGEAVAIGCALDSVYAFDAGLLGEVELDKLLHTVEEIGFAVFHPAFAGSTWRRRWRSSANTSAARPASPSPTAWATSAS